MTRKIQGTPNAGRKIKMTFFTLILLVFSIASIAQTTYYIDPTYTGATRNGSIATPCSEPSYLSTTLDVSPPVFNATIGLPT